MTQQSSHDGSGGQRLIVVLGMHRSGTSAITKSLELLGVGLGDDLYPAESCNPKGFWENQECIEINNKLLGHLGSAYDRLGFAWDEIQTDSQVSELKLMAIQLISRNLIENNGIWGFKDPRTCRLLGFWNEVFSALECEVNFVIAVRNPASVAASLATRDGIPPEKIYFLWLQHVLPSISFTKVIRRIVVDYDELLANPYSQIARISAKLGLPLPDRQSPLVRDYENNFLESDLRHTSFTEAELALDSRASKMVAATYNLLHRLAKDQDSLESPRIQDALDDLNARLRDVSPAFDYINHLEDERLGLLKKVAERGGQVASLNGQVANLVAERNSLLNSMSWKITKPLRYVRRGLVNKLRQAPHKDISLPKGYLGLERSVEFSQPDIIWIEKMLSHSNEVVSVLHPDWLGIKSSNQEMFDNSYYIDDSVTETSARYYCRLFKSAGVRKLVLNGFAPSHSHLIDIIREEAPQISIYAIWHSSFLQSGEDVSWRGLQTLLAYARNGQIVKIGFVKEGMAEVLSKYDVRTGFVMNLVQRIPDGPSFPSMDVGNFKLGLWNTNGSSWRKLPFAMIAGAGTVRGCTLHITGADKRTREFSPLLGVQSVISEAPIPQPEMPLRLAEMHLNLYVTLSECAPMLPLESLSVGVPCLFGPNSHYFRDNQFLHSRLVVPYPDSAQMIAKYIERALEERSDIVREYIRYAPGYNARAKQSLIDFLDM